MRTTTAGDGGLVRPRAGLSPRAGPPAKGSGSRTRRGARRAEAEAPRRERGARAGGGSRGPPVGVERVGGAASEVERHRRSHRGR
jgi:hypothetical protein